MSEQEAKAGAISAPLRELLALFQGPLRELRFGDIEKSVLEAHATDVEDAAGEVARLEEELAHARLVLEQKQEVLLQKGQRAQAYARVYAEGDEALTAALEAISLKGARPLKVTAPAAEGQAPAPRRRGRPPKAVDATLFHAPERAPVELAVVAKPVDDGRSHDDRPHDEKGVVARHIEETHVEEMHVEEMHVDEMHDDVRHDDVRHDDVRHDDVRHDDAASEHGMAYAAE